MIDCVEEFGQEFDCSFCGQESVNGLLRHLKSCDHPENLPDEPQEEKYCPHDVHLDKTSCDSCDCDECLPF